MKAWRELLFDLVDGVAHHGEAAAFERAVLIKGGDDEVAFGLKVREESSSVGQALFRLG